ncbi:MAG: glycoside hydrolase family 15 protein, partial [Candidatus Rokubacteria bacterium]|nr:glycoside hydrolase family 15 protein [Candidatus Rokubacteria bacterium]
MKRSSYRPISDYGVIGNLQTAALIARDGALDWLCLPHFDSPSLFAALLDAEKGGSFRVAPSVPFRT